MKRITLLHVSLILVSLVVCPVIQSAQTPLPSTSSSSSFMQQILAKGNSIKQAVAGSSLWQTISGALAGGIIEKCATTVIKSMCTHPLRYALGTGTFLLGSYLLYKQGCQVNTTPCLPAANTEEGQTQQDPQVAANIEQKITQKLKAFEQIEQVAENDIKQLENLVQTATRFENAASTEKIHARTEHKMAWNPCMCQLCSQNTEKDWTSKITKTKHQQYFEIIDNFQQQFALSLSNLAIISENKIRSIDAAEQANKELRKIVDQQLKPILEAGKQKAKQKCQKLEKITPGTKATTDKRTTADAQTKTEGQQATTVDSRGILHTIWDGAKSLIWGSSEEQAPELKTIQAK